MRYYFELPAGDRMQYVWCQSRGLDHDVQKALIYRAHRIWEELDTGQVIYTKLRSDWISDMSQVDMREFLVVKLRAQPWEFT